MSVRLGISPLTWTNDDMPQLGAKTPLEVCLAEARMAGFEGVELGNKFPRDAATLAPILARHDLALVSGWYSARLLERPVREELAALAPHLELLWGLGSRVMVFAEVSGCVHGDRGAPLSRRPLLDDAGWRRLGAAMTEVGNYLAGRGVRLAYHHHMGTVVQTEAEIDRLMQETGESVGLLLDTGHLTYATGDAAAVAARHGRRVAHVHLKDVRRPMLERALARDSSFLDAVLEGVFTVPGDGAVSYEPIMRALAAARYDGWLVVEAEQDPAKAHPLTYARMGHENAVRLARGAGLL